MPWRLQWHALFAAVLTCLGHGSHCDLNSQKENKHEKKEEKGEKERFYSLKTGQEEVAIP